MIGTMALLTAISSVGNTQIQQNTESSKPTSASQVSLHNISLGTKSGTVVARLGLPDYKSATLANSDEAQATWYLGEGEYDHRMLSMIFRNGIVENIVATVPHSKTNIPDIGASRRTVFDFLGDPYEMGWVEEEVGSGPEYYFFDGRLRYVFHELSDTESATEIEIGSEAFKKCRELRNERENLQKMMARPDWLISIEGSSGVISSDKKDKGDVFKITVSGLIRNRREYTVDVQMRLYAIDKNSKYLKSGEFWVTGIASGKAKSFEHSIYNFYDSTKSTKYDIEIIDSRKSP